MSQEKTTFETLSFYLLALSTALLDQFTKFAVVAAIGLGHSQPIIDGLFSLTYVQNTGAAFSIFAGHPGKLGILALAAAAGLVVYQWRARPKELHVILALGLYLGGAVGNGLDRILFGHVRDMFALQWNGQNIFPIFNVADIAMNIAVGLFLLYWVLKPKRAVHA